MQVKRSWVITVLLIAVVGMVWWLAWDLRPSHQLDKEFHKMLKAAAARNWEKTKAYMADNYRDTWGMDRETALRSAQEVCGQFLILDIEAKDVEISVQGPEAIVGCHLKLSGRGTGIAEEIMRQANSLKGDFRFAWKRKSWKPWDWKLQSVRQDEIQFDPSWLQ